MNSEQERNQELERGRALRALDTAVHDYMKVILGQDDDLVVQRSIVTGWVLGVAAAGVTENVDSDVHEVISAPGMNGYFARGLAETVVAHFANNLDWVATDETR